MSHTDQRPFCFDLRQSPQQELTKLTQMFDRGEYRFDDGVAALVDLIATGTLQFLPHALANAGIVRKFAPGPTGQPRLVIRRHIQINSLQTFVCQSRRAEVAGISCSLIRQAPQVLLYGGQRWQKEGRGSWCLDYTRSPYWHGLPLTRYLGRCSL